MISGAHAIIYSTNPEAGADMQNRGIECVPVRDEGWGLLTQVTLPRGGQLGVYQPRHARPKQMSTSQAAPQGSRRAARRGSRNG